MPVFLTTMKITYTDSSICSPFFTMWDYGLSQALPFRFEPKVRS